MIDEPATPLRLDQLEAILDRWGAPGLVGAPSPPVVDPAFLRAPERLKIYGTSEPIPEWQPDVDGALQRIDFALDFVRPLVEQPNIASHARDDMAAKMRGVPTNFMIFIPFMGAAVFTKRHGENLEQDAFIGIMGPVVGTTAGANPHYRDLGGMALLPDGRIIINDKHCGRGG